jgi:RNA polymerase sigma-70 factor (family 1)
VRAARRAHAEHQRATTDAEAVVGFAAPAFVARLQRGDSEAFDTLFSALYVDLVRFATRYTVAVEAAEDIVMEVFSRVWERCASWTPDDPTVYLYGAVRNRCRMAGRDAKRRDARLSSAETPPAMSRHADIPDHALERGDAMAALAQAIDALPERSRTIFTLRRQQLTNRQVATILGVSIKTVERELTLAFKILRAQLAPYTD